MRKLLGTKILTGYKVNVYDKPARFGRVIAFEFENSESQGKVLTVRIKGLGVYQVAESLFINLASTLREIKDRHKQGWNTQDGIRVGRYLLDKTVMVDDNYVVEIEQC